MEERTEVIEGGLVKGNVLTMEEREKAVSDPDDHFHPQPPDTTDLLT